MRRTRASFSIAILGSLLALLAACDARAPGSGGPGDERWLEGRLLAPCCWLQTLDVHESPLASELREEIHVRLAAHEAPDAIEDDLVRRYGPEVRALPKGRDPRVGMTAFVVLLVVAAGVFLARTVRRWTRAAATPRMTVDAKATRDALDDRLDEELDTFEE